MKIRNWDKIKEGTLLLISWEDIVEKAGWQTDDEAQSALPCKIKTVGWFVNNCDGCVRISSSIAEDGDKTIFVIPQGCVTDVKKINYQRG